MSTDADTPLDRLTAIASILQCEDDTIVRWRRGAPELCSWQMSCARHLRLRSSLPLAELITGGKIEVSEFFTEHRNEYDPFVSHCVSCMLERDKGERRALRA